LNAAFSFADADALVEYFGDLGVDTLYLSPILLSAPGSTHGYDVNDYRRIDPELGGLAGFERLVAHLHERGMGVLLDFVPNHMGIDGPFNTWWRDVLESGRDSPHARFFDIFWDRHDDARILLPLLEDHYGRVLEAGKLRLVCRRGELAVAYGQTSFPLTLRSYTPVLQPLLFNAAISDQARGGLREWLLACGALEGRRGPIRRKQTAPRARRRAALKSRLQELLAEHGDLGRALDDRLTQLNGDAADPRSVDQLHAILEMQHYRLARWQTGAHDASYRRFFAIDSLVGLRMEHLEVFQESHALVRQLLATGLADGLRIDHIDGLWDPHQYLERVQTLAAAAEAPSPDPLYVVVEKILTSEERLPAGWLTHGTTGYEFCADVTGLFVDAAAEEHFTQLYQQLAGRRVSFQTEARRAKRAILDDLLANTAAILAGRLADLIQNDRRQRDLSRHELRLALREILANFAVYRTYRRGLEPVTAEDRAVIDGAAREAERQNPLASPEAFDFVRDALIGTYPAEDADPAYRGAVARWAMSVQQHTGAIMAKSVEDTAFFRYNRFIALNEVGSDPGRFGVSVNAFHQHNLARMAAPHGLLATSTHDTKLSEDVRARLCVLSELGDEWEQWTREWFDRHGPHRTVFAGRWAPDANEEYRLYQTLIGAWPVDGRVDAGFRERIQAALIKTTNEARLHSTWQHPHEAWLAAVTKFAEAILLDDSPGGFVERMTGRARRIAELAVTNTLAQVVLKVTCPGVPDVFQGQETVELALLDPDNRRAVDYGRRQALLRSVDTASWPALLSSWATGGVKLRVLRDLLRFRRAHPRVFREGTYRPLGVRGTHASRVVAFAREAGGDRLVVIVPRLTAPLGWPPLGEVWGDTEVEVEGGVDVLTGRTGRSVRLAELLADLPVAVIRREIAEGETTSPLEQR
jgi:(1->4)-alpha-D-glucan 1-alpha-D-glucosylmutase